jgi:hypothetical protein
MTRTAPLNAKSPREWAVALAMAVVGLAAVQPACAAIASAAQGRGSASLRVEAPVDAGADAPGVRETAVTILGDPGRIFQISLPRGAGLILVSRNSGDITRTALAQFDAAGRDLIHIRSGAAAPAPVVVAVVYE